MQVLSWSNWMNQHSGYGAVQRHVLPWIAENTEHDVHQLAQSGVVDAAEFEYRGVTVWPGTSRSGKMCAEDLPHVVRKTGADVILAQLDLWAEVDAVVRAMESIPDDVAWVNYAPLHTDPLAPPWEPILKRADANIPYTEFAARTMEQSDAVPPATIEEPVYHGVDADVFHPVNPDDRNVGGIPDGFLVGMFKNLQGTRADHELALRSFRDFLDLEELWDEAYLYLHSSHYPKNSWDILSLMERYGLKENVLLPDQAEYDWGMDEAGLAGMYSACDVLLNVCRAEGFGLPILESFACGTPVVAGAFSSMPELLRGEEGETRADTVESGVVKVDRGWLVPTWGVEVATGKNAPRRTYRSEHVVRALQAAYHNRQHRDRAAQNARSWAQQHPWSEKAQRIVEVLEAIAAPSSAAESGPSGEGDDGGGDGGEAPTASEVEDRLKDLGYLD